VDRLNFISAAALFTMASDFCFAVRNLFRNPRFSLVAIITLAVGIGVSTAIFGVCDWALFRSYKFPSDVYFIGGKNDQTAFSGSRFEYQVRAYEQQKTAFSEYAKSAYFNDNIVVDTEPVTTSWTGIDPNLLPLLGIKPRLGRNFVADEARDGHNDVVIVSDSFWKRNLGAKPDVLGKQIRVGSSLCTIVGVLDRRFPNYIYSEVFRPLVYHANPADPGTPQFRVFGKLRPGISGVQATSIMDAIPVDEPAQLKWWVTNDHPVVMAMPQLTKSDHRDIYWIMLAAVACLYAIACLNASNLILIRMFGQRRESSIRLSLGSSRARIIRQLAIDSLLLAVCASILGVLIANVLLPTLLAVTGNSVFGPKWMNWNVSWRALAVLIGLSLISALSILVLPVMRIFREDVQVGLKDGGNVRGESPALARLRALFVVLQAALAVILLSGAGLMIHTFQRLQHVDVGFDPAGKAKIFVLFPPEYSTEKTVRLQRLQKIQDELVHVPGVSAASFGADLLLPGYYFAGLAIQGPNSETLHVSMNGFSANFPTVSGITLKQGEWLGANSQNQVLVNEALAKTLWPNQNPVGQYIRPAESKASDWKGWQVMGVIHDLAENLRDRAGLYVYMAEDFSPESYNTFIIRLSHPLDGGLEGRIRKQLYHYDPRMIVSNIQSLDDVRSYHLWAESLANAVLKILALIALVLAVVGIYSVLAFTVDQRMNEFGVRMALGATRSHLVALVVRRSLTLTVIGLVAGVASSLFLARLIQSLLFQTTAEDPSVLLGVCGLMLAASTLACLLPCHRAAGVEVAHLLRTQ